MDSKTLMTAYMRAKNYEKFSDVCQDLGFSSAYIADVNHGRKQFTDETAIFLAKEAGLDPAEVIISLQAIRAKSDVAQKAWYDVLKKYCGASAAALLLGLTVINAPSEEASLTSHNIYYVK